MTAYADTAIDYLDRGYLPLPLPPRAKKNPPPGFTGAGGIEPDRDQVVRWIAERGDGNVAIRLTGDVVGIDVDHYGDKRGLDDLARIEAVLGELPPTIMSTSRDNRSGIRLFRVPVGTQLRGSIGPTIEVIQRTHRYVVAPPSVHPEGRIYRWVDTHTGADLVDPWDVDQLPPLPDAWIDYYGTEVRESAPKATEAVVEGFRSEHQVHGDPRRLVGIEGLLVKSRESHGRHDTLVGVACHAMREAAAGAYSADDAIAVLRSWWVRVMDDRARLDGREFDEAIAYAVAQVAAEPDKVEQIRTEIAASTFAELNAFEPSGDTDRAATLPDGLTLWSPDDERPGPRRTPEMFHGPLGAFALDAANYTEADPVAIYAQALTVFGVAANRSAYMVAGNAKHPAALFSLIVGATGKGRKGVSGQVAEALMKLVDGALVTNRMFGGFGSGEAIVAEFAGADLPGDTGPRDIRGVIREREFGLVLSAAARQGATVSEQIRNAWDGVPLENRTRGAGRLVATDYHLGAIGHITRAELQQKLAGVDVHNGMVNRWLMFWTVRGQLQPDGGNVPDDVFARYAPTLAENLVTARRCTEMRRSPAATARWAEVYQELAEDDPPGALGGAISRADAQTLRLSLAIALADGSTVIEAEHVDAAFAVWTYCRATAAHIFGDSTGNADADRLLGAIRGAGGAGMTATDQRALFSNHPGRADAARVVLQQAGLVTTVKRSTGGRPAEVSFAIAPPRSAEVRSLSSLSSPSHAEPKGEVTAGVQVRRGATEATKRFPNYSPSNHATATEATEATNGRKHVGEVA